MTINRRHFLAASAAAIPALRGLQPRLTVAPSADRMAWWREARFGMFLHWGLYSILAGKWKEDDRWAEWIRHNAKIPIDEYDQLRARWNPTGFDPDQWAHMAQRAGMRYAVLTTKHHDGFCLFDSKATDFDVMQTPSTRDICRDLAPALRKRGIRVGWYHSIMDWHHPDYLPRRDWEATSRPASEAQFARYVTYLQAQVDELLTNYGAIDVLWFDGQWEATWTHQLALELEQRIRRRAPHIVINDRINGTGTPKGGRLGDFGTPENEVPSTGTPERDWESCMTMNENWGFKAKDQNWKSPQKLVELLVETASKGATSCSMSGRWRMVAFRHRRSTPRGGRRVDGSELVGDLRQLGVALRHAGRLPVDDAGTPLQPLPDDLADRADAAPRPAHDADASGVAGRSRRRRAGGRAGGWARARGSRHGAGGVAAMRGAALRR
jgi:alpha-L-fucosidase